MKKNEIAANRFIFLLAEAGIIRKKHITESLLWVIPASRGKRFGAI